MGKRGNLSVARFLADAFPSGTWSAESTSGASTSSNGIDGTRPNGIANIGSSKSNSSLNGKGKAKATTSGSVPVSKKRNPSASASADGIPMYVSTQRIVEVVDVTGGEDEDEEGEEEQEVGMDGSDVNMEGVDETEEVDAVGRPVKKRKLDPSPSTSALASTSASTSGTDPAVSISHSAPPSSALLPIPSALQGLENGVGSALIPSSTPSKTDKTRVKIPSEAELFASVPHYTDISEVPLHLRKYYGQRYRLFSLFSQPPGCRLDEEGWFSVTPERLATHIAERCRCDVVLDAFCGVGGNAIAFAAVCERVIALDINPTRLALARHNARVYGVEDRIEFVLADYTDFARAYLSATAKSRRKIDVVFLSPPWGGPGYIDGSSSSPSATVPSTHEQEHPVYNLTSILPIPGPELFALTRQITPNVALFLPRNTAVRDISALLEVAPCPLPGSSLGGGVEGQEGKGGGEEKGREDAQEQVEVEELWMGNKLKALGCYFGGLAGGQEWMFDL